MICCDTCPYSTTCEELDDADDWGDPGDFEWGDDDWMWNDAR